MHWFDDIIEKRISTFIHHDSGEDACDAMFVGGPVALAWKHFDSETRESARKEYLQTLFEFKKGEAYDVPAEFVVVKGVKL